ncbi:MAG: hypothetical protein IJ094_12200 [Bacilli bacterium]|nr:hypothetical protein [Bacilli bacterium]
MRNDLRLVKKDIEMKVIIKPYEFILNDDLIEVLSKGEREVILKTKKDVYILGNKSKDGWFKIDHVIEACKGRKTSLTVTPWYEMSLKLRENNYNIVKVLRGIEPIHYKDELCIPYNIDYKDGKFYIIKKEDAKRYIDRELTQGELIEGRKRYYKKHVKHKKPFSITIGINLEKKLNLNENIDKLIFHLYKNDGKEINIKFNVINKHIDTYRFLSIFDGEEYKSFIKNEDIENSKKIKIRTYKNEIIVEDVEILIKDLI